MDYEYYYNNARNRYYNACSEINNVNSSKRGHMLRTNGALSPF